MERPLVGTELVADVIQSWQPALCANGGAVYSFAPTPDVTNAVQLSSSLPGSAGLAFTTTPIEFAGTGPPVVYAPVAVTALAIGFHIDAPAADGRPQKLQHIKLSPILLGKALTQSYPSDVPGGNTTVPDWARLAPTDVTVDRQWKQLNPSVSNGTGSGTSIAPLVTADQSADNGVVWSWVQSDPGARAWLRGQVDPNGMVVNPNYKPLHLGNPPASTNYPRADPTCFRPAIMPPEAPKDACLTTIDTSPYMNSLEDAAVHVQRNDAGAKGTTWDPAARAPNGTSGYWGKNEPLPAGHRFTWAITATSDAAKYGLQDVTLCYADGGGCVAPDSDSLRAAVDAAQPDSTGLLHVNPADPGVGGYPLTQVVYAAVRTNQDPDALRDDAKLLDYAAAAGQKPGVNLGELPPGYLPLPDALRTQTRAVADTLRADAAAQPNGNSPGGPNGGGGSTTPNGSGAPNPASNQPGSGANQPPGSARPVTGPTASAGQVPAELAAKATPGTDVGAARWALLAVLICGLVGALAGPLIRHPPTGFTRIFRRPFWLRRSSPS